ncbi:MAG: OadG family protein [Peptococcaceae bacterium]|nr:OadG family protein [Peptococcaceae bacterium]
MVDVLGVGGTLQYGFQVAVIGMVVVFVGLIILIAMIYVMGAVLKLFASGDQDGETGRETEPAAADQEPGRDPDELVAVIAAAVAASGPESEDETVAAIAAVLAVLEQEGQSQVPVMSRAGGDASSAWSVIGRIETQGIRS